MKYIPLLLLCSFLISCGFGKSDQSELEELVANNTSDSTTTDKFLIENLRINYSQIIEPEGKENIVIPILLEERYYEKGLSYNDYSNIIFYNSQEQKTKLLFSDSVDIISKINYFVKPKTPKIEGIEDYSTDAVLLKGNYDQVVYDYLFLEISPWKTKKELKAEQKENSSYKKMRISYQDKGESGLYITDFKGESLTRLTPENTRVVQWQVLNNTSIILAKVFYDSNKDKLFNSKDEIRLLRIDLNSPGIGVPILNQSEENLIKTNLLKGKTGLDKI